MILKLLEFLNANFVNLSFLKMKFLEYVTSLEYNEDQEKFNISPEELQEFTACKDMMAVYNKKVKTQLINSLTFKMISTSKQSVEKYVDQFKNNFQDYEYSSEIRDLIHHYYYFRKSSNINENFELCTEFKLQYVENKNANPNTNQHTDGSIN